MPRSPLDAIRPSLVITGLLLLAVTAPARATVHVPGDAASIADGLALAQATWDTHVQVGPGDYYEQNLNIPAGLHLEGGGAAFTRIMPSGTSVALLLQPGAEVSNLAVEGGTNAMSWNGGGTGTFFIHDVWLTNQSSSPLAFDGGATIVLDFIRSVVSSPGLPVEIWATAASYVTIRGNHFVGTASSSYLEMWIEGDDSGSVEIRSNIFENGDYALTTWFEPGGNLPFGAMISNNVFVNNDYGFQIACTNIGVLAQIWVHNNWFVNNGVGQDITACDMGVVELGWNGYNGYWSNATDIDGGTVGFDDVEATPMFVNVVPDNVHLPDDYTLLMGSPGIDAGRDVSFYYDVDGSRNDIGAYGGAFGVDWNWDGDPVGHADGDCNDRDAYVFPGAPELCDGIDNDCDNVVPADESTDADGDTYLACDDCDDTQNGVYPGASEICDGFDSDCDGVLPDEEVDLDGDGAAPCEGDCDDSDPALNLADADGDGASTCDHDCDDGHADTYPGAPELCDGLDNDCDGNVPDGEFDVDGDGFAPCADDCDDLDDQVFPAYEETDCGDGKDNDCDGDTDGDDSDCSGGDDDTADDDDDDTAGDDDDTAGDDDDTAGDDDDDDDTDDDIDPPMDDDDDGVPGGFHCQCEQFPAGRPAVATVLVAMGAIAAVLRRRP
jgi:hypothetical protein